MILSSVCLIVCLSVCLSMMLCIVAERYILQQKCLHEQVNRKCPLYTSFNPVHRAFPIKILRLLHHRRLCHVANTLKHDGNKQTAKIMT